MKSKEIIVEYTAESQMRHPLRLVFEFIQEIVSIRELIWALFVRDIKAKYRQSIFGYLWIVAPALATTAIWFFLNSQGIVRVEESKIPYAAFVLVGQILWGAFSASIIMPLAAFNGSQSVVMKLKVPPEAFVIASLGGVFFDIFVRVLLLVPILLFFDISFSWSSFLFLPILLALSWMGLAVGLFFVPIGSLFSDVGRALSLVVPFLMYLTPVVYPVPTEGFAGSMMKWNPLVPFIEAGRDALTLGTFSGAGSLVGLTVASIIVSGCGFLMIRVVRDRLIERMGM